MDEDDEDDEVPKKWRSHICYFNRGKWSVESMLQHVKTTCRFPKLTDYPKSSMKPLQAHVVQKKLGTGQFPFDHRSKPLEGGKAAMAFNATWLSWTSSGASSQRSRHAWRVGCPRLSQGRWEPGSEHLRCPMAPPRLQVSFEHLEPRNAAGNPPGSGSQDRRCHAQPFPTPQEPEPPGTGAPPTGALRSPSASDGRSHHIGYCRSGMAATWPEDGNGHLKGGHFFVGFNVIPCYP